MRNSFDVYLFGDSILENSSYVELHKDVITNIECKLKTPSLGFQYDIQLHRFAKDGAMTADIRDQVIQAKSQYFSGVGYNIAVFTGGGNDALGMLHLLRHLKSYDLDHPLVQKEWNYWMNVYNELLEELIYEFTATIPCTIYNEIPTFSLSDKLIFRLYNDYIMEKANALDLKCCDIRTVMKDPEDYSEVSPIEPSVIGGEWIAELIVQQIVNKIKEISDKND